MNKILKKQIEHMEKQEQKLLNKKENQLIKTKLTPLIDKIEEKIPAKLKDTLDLAFYKSFELVFEKGNKLIEMTYDKEKILLQYDINNYAVEKSLSKQHIQTIDKQANKSKLMNAAISMTEGTVLGILGIGLPDIPLFISVMMKTIQEVALNYGFKYESDQEKSYMLLIICGALSKGEKQKEFNHQITLMEEKIIEIANFETDLKQQMKITADLLSNTLITAKFIQGFPIIGALGGVVNHSIVSKISKFASLKYKKRYLIEKAKRQK